MCGAPAMARGRGGGLRLSKIEGRVHGVGGRRSGMFRLSLDTAFGLVNVSVKDRAASQAQMPHIKRNDVLVIDGALRFADGGAYVCVYDPKFVKLLSADGACSSEVASAYNQRFRLGVEAWRRPDGDLVLEGSHESGVTAKVVVRAGGSADAAETHLRCGSEFIVTRGDVLRAGKKMVISTDRYVRFVGGE